MNIATAAIPIPVSPTSALGQSTLYFVSNVARRGISFFLLPIYTRCLSPSDYGVIELVELLVMVTTLVVGVPVFAESMTRLYFDYATAKERASVVSTSLILTILLSVLVIVFGTVGAQLASSVLFHTPRYASLIAWAFVSVLLSNVAEIGLAFKRIQRRAATVAIFSCTQVTLTAGLNVYFLLFLKKGVWGFLLSKLIAAGLGAVYLLAVTVRETGFHVSRDGLAKMVRFGSPFVLSGAGLFVIHFSDRFFLNSFATTAQVGLYALAYKFGFIISYLVGNSFKSVWHVNAYEYGHSNGWKERAAHMAQYLLLFLVGTAIVLSVFAKPIIRFIAPLPYFQAAFLMPVLIFAYVFREIGDFFSSILFIDKRVVHYTAIVIACAALNIILDATLIRGWGAAGAAWATFTTWAAYMVAFWLMVQRAYQLPLQMKRVAVISTGCVLIVAAAGLTRDLSSVAELSMRMLLVGITCVLLWKQCLSSQHYAEIRGHLKRSLVLLSTPVIDRERK